MSLDQYKLTFPPSEIIPAPFLIQPTTSSDPSTHLVAFRPYGDYTTADKIIVTVHGLTGDSLNFHYLSEAVLGENAKNGTNYAIINIDIMGRGDSNPSIPIDTHHFTYSQYLEDIVTILAYVKSKNTSPDLKWYWIGTSMGGLLAIVLTTQTARLQAHGIKFFAYVFNDIGYSVPYDEIQRISEYVIVDSSFSTQIEAASYFEKLYKSHFGPKSDTTFFMHRALYALKFDVKDQVYKVNYDRRGVAQGLLDTSFCASTGDETVEYSFLPHFTQLAAPLLVYRGALSALLPEELLTSMENIYKQLNLDFQSVSWTMTGHVPPLYTIEEFEPIIAWFNKY